MKLGDDKHPDAHRFPDADAAVTRNFARRFAASVQDKPKAYLDVEAWRAVLRVMLEETREIVAAKQASVKARKDAPENIKHKTLRDNAALLRKAKTALRIVQDQIDQAARLPGPARAERLTALWRNWIMPTVHSYGEMPGKYLAAPDWQAATGVLRKESSEPTAIKLGDALERGKFRRTEDSDYPLADVSGRLGNASVIAHAEITPNVDDGVDGDGAAIVQAIAERLADPKLGHGIRTERAYAGLMHAWLARRGVDGNATITIGELALDMGFTRDPRRGFDSDVFLAVRECVAVLARLTMKAFNLPALKGLNLPTKLEELAFTFTYFAPQDGSGRRAGEAWEALSFRPNKYLSAAVTQKGAFIMGTDPKLNRLSPRRERAEVLIGKYLERQWRMNLNKEHGSVTRTVLALLTNGMGLADDDARSPRAETLDRLVAALDKLEEHVRTLKHWQGDDQWQAAMAEADAIREEGKYVTRGIWQKLLDARITMEAGTQYMEHYSGHSLTYQGGNNVDPLAQEFRGYLVRVGRAQATVAAEIGMSASALSRFLAGSTKSIKPRARERIEALIAAEKQAPLPLE